MVPVGTSGTHAASVTTCRTRLGEWVPAAGHTVTASIAPSHSSPANYAAPTRFDPARFLHTKPDTNAPAAGAVAVVHRRSR